MSNVVSQQSTGIKRRMNRKLHHHASLCFLHTLKELFRSHSILSRQTESGHLDRTIIQDGLHRLKKAVGLIECVERKQRLTWKEISGRIITCLKQDVGETPKKIAPIFRHTEIKCFLEWWHLDGMLGFCVFLDT